MIQETNLSNNDCYMQTVDPIFLPLNSGQIGNEYLLSGQYVAMNISNQDLDSSPQQMQQQQQPQEHEETQELLTQISKELLTYAHDNNMLHQHVDQQLFQTFYAENMYQQQQGEQLPPPQQQQQQQQTLLSTPFVDRIIPYNTDECPPTPDDTPPKESTLNEISNTSDTSTVEDDVNGADDKYAYLEELNSDNLMQFSQQSELQEMLLKEQLQSKPNLHTLPTIEEHDIGDYNFKLIVPSQHNKGKTSWNYSEELNKLYIRMNDIFTIDAVYTPKLPVQQLRIRTFICFFKEVSEPVLRCQNHISKDNEVQIIKRESLLRCENPDAEHHGSANGKSIKERYSVVVPLSGCLTQSEMTVRQAIALKFTCQNSCIGRKETCLIFVLEGMNGEILSQRMLNIRICSCPKRDKAHDEKSLKRRNSCDIFPVDAKIPKRELMSPTSPLVKDENSCSDYESALKQFDIQRTANGGVRLVLELSSTELALSTIDYAFAKESSEVLHNRKNAAQSSRNIRKLKRLYDKCADFR